MEQQQVVVIVARTPSARSKRERMRQLLASVCLVPPIMIMTHLFGFAPVRALMAKATTLHTRPQAGGERKERAAVASNTRS